MRQPKEIRNRRKMSITEKARIMMALTTTGVSQENYIIRKVKTPAPLQEIVVQVNDAKTKTTNETIDSFDSSGNENIDFNPEKISKKSIIHKSIQPKLMTYIKKNS